MTLVVILGETIVTFWVIATVRLSRALERCL